MFQKLILEKSDIDLLKSGQPLTLTIAGGRPIMLEYMNGKPNKVKDDGLTLNQRVLNALKNGPMKRSELIGLGNSPGSIDSTLYVLRQNHKIKKTDMGFSLNGK